MKTIAIFFGLTLVLLSCKEGDLACSDSNFYIPREIQDDLNSRNNRTQSVVGFLQVGGYYILNAQCCDMFNSVYDSK